MKRFLILFIVFAVGILTLFFIKSIFIDSYYYYGVLGTIFAAMFTALLVWVASGQLGKLNKTSSADFIHKLDNDFFTTETRTLVALIDCEALEFIDPTSDESQSIEEIESWPYFEVNQNELGKTKLPDEIINSLSNKKYYSTWEIDDLLLGLCENIGMLEQRGVVTFQMVYDVFGYYLELIWKYDHVTDYIMYCRYEDKNEEDTVDKIFL